MIDCKNCGSAIDPKTRKIFCSSSCSATYSNKNRKHSDETKKRISNGILKARGEGRSKTPTEGKKLKTFFKTCISCKKEFESLHENKQACSISCKNYAYENKLYDLKGKSGGYRKGGGRGKSGWYKGYWCDSSYELAWVMYHIDHGIKFRRNTQSFPYEFDGDPHLYYPDFELLETNQLIEIKGFFTEQTYQKIKSVNNRQFKVLGKNEMIPYIEYAKSTYGKDFVNLYDKQ